MDDDPFAPAPASGKKKESAAIPAPQPAPPVNDDPFAPLPAATSAPAPAEPESDDPFAPLPAAPPATNSRPTVAAPTAAPPRVKVADAPQLGSDGRLLVREWIDNSGQFRVQGRLVLILDGKVRVLKETGRTTTVPIERLSEADRSYVAEVVARYGADLEQLDQLAAR